MSKIHDGGPAFPIPPEDGFHYGDHGLSKREYFAGLALSQSVMDYDRSGRGVQQANPLLPYATQGSGTREEIIARQAVRYADALIAELSKEPKP